MMTSELYQPNDLLPTPRAADSWDPMKSTQHREGSKHSMSLTDVLTSSPVASPASRSVKQENDGGGADDRYLWPAMFRVISETRPHWVIGENVPGIVNMALEQVCTDLERLGYEVQPLIIPAAAIGAPHKRDRVWIVACRDTEGVSIGSGLCESEPERQWGRRSGDTDRITANACDERLQGSKRAEAYAEETASHEPAAERHHLWNGDFPDWNQGWVEAATALCRVDDGLPVRLDGLELSKSGHRTQRLKALGNSIVPQVAMELMRSIKAIDEVAV